ncbi:MAG: type I restriction enzyme HsdR N-terminal domain-containing protein [Flavobacteriaceae bacterium]|nr:type I restriction enzyme HsdR N-terminal domain-containing protein [Flavobacteriaceae bacterium]
MQTLSFPPYAFRFKSSENKRLIFDPIRKKYVQLQPEEWVRQHCLQFILQDKGYPASLTNVEKQIKVGATTKRYDIIVYKSDGRVALVVECKSPEVSISQDTFDQIARYNLTLKADYLMVTNGLDHYFCQMDHKQERYIFLKDIPNYCQ